MALLVQRETPGARRFTAYFAVRGAIVQGHFHFNMHVAAVPRQALVVSDRRLFEQSDHVRSKPALVGKGIDTDTTVEERHGDRVLKAELPFQPRARIRAVGIADFWRHNMDPADA